MDPLITDLARAEAADLASNMINAAVDQQIEQGNIHYKSLITLERDSSGSICALTANMQEMNRLKTKLLIELDDNFTTLEQSRITIPLGNVTGIQLLSGRGPEVPVKIVSIRSSDADFHGEFTDAGINQTIHKIILTVSMDLLILLPGGTVTERVSTDICVAETVLLGPVPGSYTYFHSAENAADAVYFSED